MSTDENKEIVRRFQAGMVENFRTGSLDTLTAILDPDCAFGMLQVLPVFRTAFPDLQVTLGEMIAEDDKVAYRLIWTGTHIGEFMGIAATGKRVTVTETHVDQIVNGKIVRHDGDSDQLGMLQQLGVIPAMG
jgi:predicted ester cyclase